MAHFAEIDSNNKVLRVVVACNQDVANNGLRVIVIDNQDVDNNGGDQSTTAENFVASLVPFSENGVRWVQTSYNNNFRGRFAGTGNLYHPEQNKFYSGQPFPSWTLNNTTLVWEAPTAMPTTYTQLGEPFLDKYNWNEGTQSWDLVEAE